MWHVINREVGKSLKHDEKIELHIGTNIISDPQEEADMLNKFFVEQIDELMNRNSSKNGNYAQVPKQTVKFLSENSVSLSSY
jgi:hypothetical protein